MTLRTPIEQHKL